MSAMLTTPRPYSPTPSPLNERVRPSLPQANEPTIAVRIGRQTTHVHIKDIDWIQAARNYLRLYVGSEYHLLRETMNHLLERLDEREFIRIHRCTIVRRSRIKGVQHQDNGQSLVTLHDGTVLRMSRGYRHALDDMPQLDVRAANGLPW